MNRRYGTCPITDGQNFLERGIGLHSYYSVVGLGSIQMVGWGQLEKRRHPRHDYFSRVALKFENSMGEAVWLTGMVEDKSQSGLGIRVDSPLEPGLSITIVQGSVIRGAIVRRCLRETVGYFVGVEFLEGEVPRTAT